MSLASDDAAPARQADTTARLATTADDRDFTYQSTRAADLPDPRPLLANLTRCVFEVIAGARELEQLSRWVTEDVYRKLLARSVIAARARAVTGKTAVRPAVTIGSILLQTPVDDVVEAVVMVHGRGRSRAVAIRLEGIDRRWRATALGVV